MEKAGWAVAGLIFCAFGAFAAFLVWSSLPPGRYPAFIAAFPALPYVLAAWHGFKRAGWAR